MPSEPLSSVAKEVKSLLHNTSDHTVALESLSTPTPSPTQYLIRVHAVGITKGELLWPEPNTIPSPIPGFDISGTVVTSPSPNSRFQPGNKVYALTAFDRPANAREITIIEESEIARMPEGSAFEQAAAVPMSALTAWQALFQHGGLFDKANSERNRHATLLVIGASGAVGIWAIQLAKWAGVGHVFGMCGPRNVEFVARLGADEIINYREKSLREWIAEGGEVRKFDIVIDCVGGDALKEGWTAVKKGGLLLSIVQPVDVLKPETGASEEARGKFFIVNPDGVQLGGITDLIEKDNCKPVVDGVWKFDDYKKAFQRAESGRARGKVVLKVE